MSKQLDIEELREQFESRYRRDKERKLERHPIDNDQYIIGSVNRDWLVWCECAKANGILKEIEEQIDMDVERERINYLNNIWKGYNRITLDREDFDMMVNRLVNKCSQITNLKAENERLKGDKWISFKDEMAPVGQCLVYRNRIFAGFPVNETIILNVREHWAKEDMLDVWDCWQPLPTEPINK